ncbi:hypothetical protein KXX39_005662 [Aspergillus fumigatus]|nr:hypothetical protein KXX39_005662 [Aspergillus fumigatus]
MNLPGYGKNWLWRGDDLWHDRWQEVLSVRPEFVEIISWNDYSESHYIGPLHEEKKAAEEPYIANDDDAKFSLAQEIVCWGVDYYKPAFTDFRGEEFHTSYPADFRRDVLPDGVEEVGFI